MHFKKKLVSRAVVLKHLWLMYQLKNYMYLAYPPNILPVKILNSKMETRKMTNGYEYR